MYWSLKQYNFFMWITERRPLSLQALRWVSDIPLQKEPRGDLWQYEAEKLDRKMAVTSGSSVVSSSVSISGYEELHRYNWMGKDLARTNTSQLTFPTWKWKRRKERCVENEQFYKKVNFHCHLPLIPQNRHPGWSLFFSFAGSTTWGWRAHGFLTGVKGWRYFNKNYVFFPLCYTFLKVLALSSDSLLISERLGSLISCPFL